MNACSFAKLKALKVKYFVLRALKVEYFEEGKGGSTIKWLKDIGCGNGLGFQSGFAVY